MTGLIGARGPGVTAGRSSSSREGRLSPIIYSLEHWQGVGIGALRFARYERALGELGVGFPMAASAQDQFVADDGAVELLGCLAGPAG